MSDSTTTPGYNPSDVEATRGREQGLGMGERDLKQQRDVGDTVAAPEEERDFQSAAQDAEGAQDDDTLDETRSDSTVSPEDDDGDAPIGLPA